MLKVERALVRVAEVSWWLLESKRLVNAKGEGSVPVRVGLVTRYKMVPLC